MDMPEHCSQESFSIDTVEDGGRQFEATLLWDNIVGHLESIKCGRHTQALRTFSNCFQGSAAVDSLLAHLSIILAKVIKREQVQILCQKLLGTGVIEDVRNKEKDVFRESRLYRHTLNHFWSVSNINSSNQDLLEKELSRAKSAENISTGNDDTCFQDDLKGYASDSTISCSSRTLTNKKRKNSSRKKRCSDLVLKRDAGFFQSLGTKLLINSSSVCMSSYRLVFKGSDNALLSAPGGSNESLVPPETKQRRKMSVCRGKLKGHAREENLEHSMISSTRRTLDRKRENGTCLLSLRRWSMEKMKDDGKTFPPLITVSTVEKVREDRKGQSLISGWRRSNDKLREDSRSPSLLDARRGFLDPTRGNPSLTSTRRCMDKLKVDSSLLDARIGSLDPTRGSLISMRDRDDINRTRRGSVDAQREHGVNQSLITTRRRSFDNGQPQDAFICSRPRIHARRRRRSPGQDGPIHSGIPAKERLETGRHKSRSNTLTKKSTISKQVKACKMKIQKRRHSFSSVEDYMAGPSENSTDCTDAQKPSRPPMAWQSGDKWIVYGFV